MAARGFIELLRLAERARMRKQSAQGQQKGERWSGVAFRLGGQQFISPLGEISEVLNLQDYTPVPSAQSWLLGLSNVRGRLLPLTDLAGFAGLIRNSRHAKVLVIDQPDLFSGLLVDEVQGIQHFGTENYHPDVEQIPEGLAGFVEGRFADAQGQNWIVMLPSRLISDQRYMNAAVR